MLVFWFIVVVSFINLLLFCIWSKGSFANVLLKMYFFVSVVVAAYIVVTTSPQQMQDSVAVSKQVVGN